MDKPFLLRTELMDVLERHLDERPTLQGSRLEYLVSRCQEAATDGQWVCVAVRRHIGVWSYYRFHLETFELSEISVTDYLAFKERLVLGNEPDPWPLLRQYAPPAEYEPWQLTASFLPSAPDCPDPHQEDYSILPPEPPPGPFVPVQNVPALTDARARHCQVQFSRRVQYWLPRGQNCPFADRA